MVQATQKTWGEAADAGQPMTEVFHLLMTLAEHEGRVPVGFWEFALDGGWRVTVNGSDGPQDVDGIMLKRFHTLVEYHGWPAMLVTPFYGEVLGSHGMPPVKMEHAFLTALKAKLE